MIQISSTQTSTLTLSVDEYIKERSAITNEGRKVQYNGKDYVILSLQNGGELWCSAPLSSKILSGESINISRDCKVLRNTGEGGKIYDYLVSKGKVTNFGNINL